MSQPRVALVFNPMTRNHKVEERRRQTRGALERAGLDVLWLETTAEDAGEGMLRRALETGIELVLASGGDGTIMACASALADTGVPLALLPAGTGNLLAVNLDIPRDLEGAVEVALAGDRRRIDLGSCEQGCFAVMAGMGFDAAMMRDTIPQLKARVGALAYIAGALRHLRARAVEIQLQLDGRATVVAEASMVLVGNMGRLQGGLRALPDADARDGLLNVAIVRADSITSWARVAWRLLRGRAGDDERVQTHVASSVRVRAARPLPVELDGDVFDDAQVLNIEIRPRALTICVPRGDESKLDKRSSSIEGRPGTIHGGGI
jgi:YegS/Rv2252/BmrU family lipid kinase